MKAGKLTSETSALKFTPTKSNYSSKYSDYTKAETAVYLWKNSPKDLSPYSTLKITISGAVENDWKTGSDNNWQWNDGQNYIYVRNTSGNLIANRNFKYSYTEQSIIINLSGINISGYVDINFYYRSDFQGLGSYNGTDPSYIHAINLS